MNGCCKNYYLSEQTRMVNGKIEINKDEKETLHCIASPARYTADSRSSFATISSGII